MTTKVPHQSFSFLIILFLNISSYVWASQKPLEEFNIKNLAGHCKGDKVKGLNRIKNYLKKFGYIIHNNNEDLDDDYFDDVLESTVKTYQSRHSLESTGILDTETLSHMTVPRCGVPDHPHRGSKYAFFPGKEKWPQNHLDLTYAFITPVPVNVSIAIGLAFFSWAQTSSLTFTMTENTSAADLKISYKHIDGEGKILGEVYAPTNGHVVFDDQEPWAGLYYGDIPSDAFSIFSVACHEIGHLIGLDHSTFPGAAMWPYFSKGSNRGMNADDALGIRALYGYPRPPSASS